MKRALQLIVAIVVSVVCVLLSLVDITPGAMLHPPELLAAIGRIPHALVQIRDALAHASVLGFLAVCVLTILGFWVRAARWRFFIQEPRQLPMNSLFSATMIGFMANNVLPFRLGEFVRPWVLARREKLPNSMLLATIVVERVIDMLTLLLLFGLALILQPIKAHTDAGDKLQLGAVIMIGLSVALTVFMVAAERNRGVARVFLKLLPAALRDRAGRLLERFLDGCALFRDPFKLLQVMTLSVAMFLFYAVALGITGWSLHITQLPWYSGLVMLVVTAIGIMVPAAPGYVGTLNAACKLGLALWAVNPAAASAYGWFYFLSQWLPITAVGLYYLHREGLSLRSLGEAQGKH